MAANTTDNSEPWSDVDTSRTGALNTYEDIEHCNSD